MKRILRSAVWLAIVGTATITTSDARTGAQTKAEGKIVDITADLDGAGPWLVMGEWSLETMGASGKGEFTASLSMQRADNPARGVHTHHLGLNDGQVTQIAGGYRITGTAILTSNGNLAGFSGSQITVEVVGGNAVPLSNVRVTFSGGATGHFGTDPLDGVVTRAK